MEFENWIEVENKWLNKSTFKKLHIYLKSLERHQDRLEKMKKCLEEKNIPFLEEVAKVNLPIYLSTGTAQFDEVSTAINIFRERINDLVIMQCTSSYPCDDEFLNLVFPRLTLPSLHLNQSSLS